MRIKFYIVDDKLIMKNKFSKSSLFSNSSRYLLETNKLSVLYTNHQSIYKISPGSAYPFHHFQPIQVSWGNFLWNPCTKI